MGAAASVAKNLASHNSSAAGPIGVDDAPTEINSLPAVGSSFVMDASENGDHQPSTNGVSSHAHDDNGEPNGRVDGEPPWQTRARLGPPRKSSMPVNLGVGVNAANDRRQPGTGSGADGGLVQGFPPDANTSDKQRKKKSSELVFLVLSVDC